MTAMAMCLSFTTAKQTPPQYPWVTLWQSENPSAPKVIPETPPERTYISKLVTQIKTIPDPTKNTIMHWTQNPYCSKLEWTSKSLDGIAAERHIAHDFHSSQITIHHFDQPGNRGSRHYPCWQRVGYKCHDHQ